MQIRSKDDPRARGRGGDRCLMRQYRAGDTRARDMMIERYLPLAARLAMRYRNGPVALEDLLQVAAIGLVKAVDRWDADRGLAFSTFAVPTITGELRRHFRDTTWGVRPPRGLQELAILVERAAIEVAATRGREDAGYELAETRATIAHLTAALDDRERALVRLRFHEDLTQPEIARRLSCSQVQVSRALRALIAKLAAHPRALNAATSS